MERFGRLRKVFKTVTPFSYMSPASTEQYAPAVHKAYALALAVGGALDEIFIGIPSAKELGHKVALGLHTTFGDYALAIGAGFVFPTIASWLAIDEIRAAFKSRAASESVAIAGQKGSKHI